MSTRERTESPATHGHHVPLGASLVALASGVVWSLGALLARIAEGADAWQYLLWRSVAIIVVVEIVAVVRRAPAGLLVAFGSGTTMIVACLGLLLASLMFIYAVKTTTAANAAFLASVTPIVAAVLARIVLHERLTRVTVVSVLVALVGLGIMVMADLGAGNMVGNAAAVCSSFGFAIYTVCLRTDVTRDWSAVMPGYASMMIVLCGIVCTVNGESLAPPLPDLLLAAAHGGIVIVVGTVLFNSASRSVPAVAMTVFAQTEMIFVPVWVLIWFGEVPAPATIVGGSIILVAVVGKALLDARTNAAIAPGEAIGPGTIA